LKNLLTTGEIRQRDPIVASVLGSLEMGPGPKSKLLLVVLGLSPRHSETGTQKPISASGKVDDVETLDLALLNFVASRRVYMQTLSIPRRLMAWVFSCPSLPLRSIDETQLKSMEETRKAAVEMEEEEDAPPEAKAEDA
jgi:hypothetical protein